MSDDQLLKTLVLWMVHVLNLRWPFWCTRHWRAFHHSTWRMTVNSSQPLAASDFDRLMLLPATFHEPAQLWVIDPSLLLVHICVEQSTTSSSWLWTIAFRVSTVTENAFVWLKIAAPSDLLLDVVHLTNVLTYLLTYLQGERQLRWPARRWTEDIPMWLV